MTAIGRMGLAWIIVGTGMAAANHIAENWSFFFIWIVFAAIGSGLFAWNGGK
jgi:hypothetical protein